MRNYLIALVCIGVSVWSGAFALMLLTHHHPLSAFTIANLCLAGVYIAIATANLVRAMRI
jgi:hypothetical protein